jgi:hypothetical protein
MYREALALAIHRNRAYCDVKSADPEGVHREVKSFRPDLLVRNDNDGPDPEVLAAAPSWVEVKYHDSVDARISLSGRIEEFDDASLELLLEAVDKAAKLVSEDHWQ